MNNQKNNTINNVVELRQFNSVSIKQLKDICDSIKSSVDNISTVTPATSLEQIMYAAGAHFALNRLLKVITASINNTNRKG